MKIRHAITVALSSIALIGTMAANATTHTNNGNFTPKQKKAIEKIIHNYLVTNPEVLLQASVSLRKKMAKKQQQGAELGIEANKQQLFHDPASPFIGKADASKVIVEFFDYQCGHCKAMNKTIQSLVKKNKDSKVIFKEWPIFGRNSKYAATAALASMKQGKYYAFHDALLSASNPLSEDKVMQVAEKVGINIEKLKQEMQNPAVATQLAANFKLAQAIKLQGTPAFIITNKAEKSFKFIPGAASMEALQKNLNSFK